MPFSRRKTWAWFACASLPFSVPFAVEGTAESVWFAGTCAPPATNICAEGVRFVSAPSALSGDMLPESPDAGCPAGSSAGFGVTRGSLSHFSVPVCLSEAGFERGIDVGWALVCVDEAFMQSAKLTPLVKDSEARA